ncbi:type VI secretion system ATPase TssH [Acetobacter vaccinii]|uniref:Type VI secretion system ATPase TssH n=1 Tax=Acetobacter vaccinii TaxID=2592655 RepID=A0A5C1YJR7_9PROT|nr:type VI secretion system ATPase TssH [Acetobacter vaccinii]QEO16474.1 type VI secretion system ATPase TssH [Acetobacter vaccinii]
MQVIDVKVLISRLAAGCRSTVEAAAAHALMLTQYNVEVEHVLWAALRDDRSDIVLILKAHNLDADAMKVAVDSALGRLKSGSARPPGLSPEILAWVQQAWLVASLDQEGVRQVRTGHLLAAALADDALRRRMLDLFAPLSSLSVEVLRRSFEAMTEGGSEEGQVEADAPGTGADASVLPATAGGQGSMLARFCTDLTARARDGKMDPIIGRAPDIRKVVDILCRRRQNNPVLVGEPGVGKTAIAEGLAQAIVAGDVPQMLEHVALWSLDLGLLQAGAGVKGEFENRLRGLVEEVNASATPIILFIDEAHMLIGAGGQQGQNDAANLIKPALARGELRCLAATTWGEYKKYFEKDPALTRRFQPVQIDPPDEDVARGMLRGLLPMLEKHHGVHVAEDAVHAAVSLSVRYIPSRQLPDKAVSLLDTACSRVAMSRAAKPGVLSDVQQRLAMVETELKDVAADQKLGFAVPSDYETLEQKRAALQAECAALEARWQHECALVEKITTLQDCVRAGEGEDVAPELAQARQELTAVQGDQPLVHAVVDTSSVAAVVESWTGIPVGRMVGGEIQRLLSLEETLGQRVLGQTHALKAIAQAMITQRAGLTDPRKPAGVFLMVGTSGVGKTETALALAEQLYGGEDSLTVINMSEFKEEHKVSLLMGAPPGYVGYGEGGVLTEAVRRKPYSVVLLDEMEKAHPGVQDVFYQVFDKGQMKDGEGREIDFRNTVIIMTSNAGTDTIASVCADPDNLPSQEQLGELLRPELLHWFRPAFLGRCNVVAYYPLSDALIRRIVDLNLKRVAQRVAQSWGAVFEASAEVTEALAARCHETESGARVVETILTRTVLPELSAKALACVMEGGTVQEMRVSVDEAGAFEYSIS